MLFAIFIPKDTVVQVKSTEITIPVVLRRYVAVTLWAVPSAFVRKVYLHWAI